MRKPCSRAVYLTVIRNHGPTLSLEKSVNLHSNQSFVALMTLWKTYCEVEKEVGGGGEGGGGEEGGGGGRGRGYRIYSPSVSYSRQLLGE